MSDDKLKEIAERLYQGIVTPGRTSRKPNGAHREFILAALQQARDLGREEYMDLIMAVAQKWPGETRHETAKRYIVERESAALDARSSQGSDHDKA